MQGVGDQRFEAITIPHVNALFQTALRLTENRACAQEVVREAYECAWKSLCRREEWSDWRVGLFKALMQRIHRRNRGWFSAPWLSEPDQTSLEKHTQEAGDPYTFSSSPEQIVWALTRVPVPLREIILLVDCQEFSYKQAADILGLPTDVVAQRLTLGRNLLRSELNKTTLVIAQDWIKTSDCRRDL